MTIVPAAVTTAAGVVGFLPRCGCRSARARGVVAAERIARAGSLYAVLRTDNDHRTYRAAKPGAFVHVSRCRLPAYFPKAGRPTPSGRQLVRRRHSDIRSLA